MKKFYFIFVAVLIFTACNATDESDAGNLAKEAKVSECGGFEAQTLAVKDAADEMDCADETFFWEYDAASKILSFINKNVWLNCCGDHSLRVEKVDGTFVIHEKDAPEGGDARCSCMCLFDFKAEIPIVSDDSTVSIELYRFVTDSDSGDEKVWSTSCDLSKESETLIIKEDVGWCS